MAHVDASNTDKVNLSDDLDIPMRPMKNTLVLAFSFFSIYTAYLGIMDIQSSINQKSGLGIAALSSVYTTRILASTLSPLYLYFTGLKASFVLAFISQCLYTASNFYPDWLTLIPSSILVGLNMSPMWIACHLYVNAMGQYNSKINKVDLHSSLSKYQGTFFSLMSFSTVCGNFLSSVILHQSSKDQSDLNQTTICGADDCPGHENKTTIIVRPETAVIDILLGVYLACGLLGLFTTVIFLRPLSLEKSDQKSLLKKVVVCFTMFRDKKLLLFIPLCLASGINNVILHTGFTKAYVSCSVGVKMVGYVMMTLGVVTASSSFCFGRIAKYTGRRPLVITALSLDILALTSLLLWKPSPEQKYLLFVIPCIYGIADGIWATQIMALTAMAFPNRQPAVYSNLSIWYCVGFATVLLTDKLMCLKTKFYCAIGLWFIAVTAYTTLEILFSKQTDANQMDYQRFEDQVGKPEPASNNN